MDNCWGHKITEPVIEALQNISTVIKFLPQNCTYLCQPLDSFIIKKLKGYWGSEWGRKLIELIRDEQWSVGQNASGMLLNPGKQYYVELAVRSVAHVNSMVDVNGLSLVRKAMIRCGLSLNTTGRCGLSLNTTGR